ncbi:MAG: alanine racemase [Balneolaceae bacterium]|nr:alanine racemase [Balneolaceae bacterium]
MVKSPTLLLDEEICRANIQRMVEKAERHALTLKPHFKTHQSAAIGEWFRDEGVRSITVSSVQMAEYFAEHGWNDITIGFPVNIREVEMLKTLSEQIDTLSLFAYNDYALDALEKNLRTPVQIYIEIDTGANRSGLAPHQPEEISRIKNRIESSANMQFKGFYSHPGTPILRDQGRKS